MTTTIRDLLSTEEVKTLQEAIQDLNFPNEQKEIVFQTMKKMVGPARQIVMAYKNMLGLDLPEDQLTKEQKRFKNSDLGKAFSTFIHQKATSDHPFPLIYLKQGENQDEQIAFFLKQTAFKKKEKEQDAFQILYLRALESTGSTDMDKLEYQIYFEKAWKEKYETPFPLESGKLNVKKELARLYKKGYPKIEKGPKKIEKQPLKETPQKGLKQGLLRLTRSLKFPRTKERASR